ncbi:cysteine proteinases superfamily protein [Actinidia rufa]|uniref:Cysteine proteinases superfamily protein n=1 Tax=Actinidia rufa TaxID=165716 RepID=A0A7J0EF21_9ERIC|nr:cysteine proteinases superfamily protein [Actinidia rufa]
MGALTINRKRSDEYYTFDCKIPYLNSPNFDNRIDTHISKKPRISSSPDLTPDPTISSKSAVSRLYRYPEPVNRIRRQVHAPCRVSRLGFWASSNRKSKEGFVDVMGNVPSFQHDQAKDHAIQGISYLKKDKEVIEVDEETDGDGVLQGSSIEEVEFVEDESEETSGVVRDLQELDGNIVERDLQPSSSSVVSDSTNGNLEVGNVLETISLERKLELLGLPLHKKLFETAERRNPKLSSLRFEIELNEKRRETLQLLRPAKRPVEEDGTQDVLREAFLPLTKEEEAEVSRAFSNSNRRKVLVTHENANIEITGEVLQCLRPGKWLNDEVINVYLELLKEREKREPKRFLKCHFFNTFFYKKIFVPIHKEMHWCLAVINKKDQKFQYLDSLGGIDSQVLKVLGCSSLGGCPSFIHYSKNKDAWLSDYLMISIVWDPTFIWQCTTGGWRWYFVDEVKDKSGEHIDISSWDQEYVDDLPEQENGWDCGVFMIKYSDFYSRGLDLCFNQMSIPTPDFVSLRKVPSFPPLLDAHPSRDPIAGTAWRVQEAGLGRPLRGLHYGICGHVD